MLKRVAMPTARVPMGRRRQQAAEVRAAFRTGHAVVVPLNGHTYDTVRYGLAKYFSGSRFAFHAHLEGDVVICWLTQRRHHQ